MERRLEKIRYWKRCSVGSSNSRPRNIYFESGVILCRLNQELFPDPGNPIARITLPFGRSGADVVAALGLALAAGATCGVIPSLREAVSAEETAVAALDGTAPADRDPPLPRPPRPRRRLRRGFVPVVP